MVDVTVSSRRKPLAQNVKPSQSLTIHDFDPRLAKGLRPELIQNFDTGLDVISADHDLPNGAARTLDNFFPGRDGNMHARFGTELFCDLSAHFDDIIAGADFNGVEIVVNSDGQIAAISEDQSYVIIWNDTIATEIWGLNAWGPCSQVTFAQSQSLLICCNGIDKPVFIDSNLTVRYVGDPGNNYSNVNVPRAQYVISTQNYCLYGGDPFDPTTVFITSKGTFGVFEGDSGSDGVNIDLSTYVRKGDPSIRGFTPFRTSVLVQFDKQIIIGTIGTYVSTTHTPTWSDALDSYGALSQIATCAVGDQLFQADLTGINEVTRSLYSGIISVTRAMNQIKPLYDEEIAPLGDSILTTWPFMIYNGSDKQFMFFLPNEDDETMVTETVGFIFTNDLDKKLRAWSLFKNWMWATGWTTRFERVFFAREGAVFVYGNTVDPIPRDHMGWEEMFDDDTCFMDNRGFATTDPEATYTHGIAIPIDYIPPWNVMRQRLNIKKIKKIKLDTRGTARFTVQHFVDDFLADRNDLGEPFTDGAMFADGFGFDRLKYDPALEMQFIGGDALGYGGDGYGMRYGGGRMTQDERLYDWPVKGKKHKTRIFGYITEPFAIDTIALLYGVGGLKR